MGGQTSPDEDPVLRILSCRPPADAPAAARPCPEADLLAAFAEGRLLAFELATVEAHVAACEECREAVALLMEAETAPAAGEESVPVRWTAPPPSRWSWSRGFAAAAGILVLAGLAGWVLWRDGTEPGPPGTDARLVAAAADLRRSDPGLFSGFAPLSAAELAASPPVVRSGGPVKALSPAGTVLATRPAFRWEADREDAVSELTLMTNDGRAVWKRRVPSGRGTQTFDYPGDAPPLEAGGAYLFEIGGETGGFRVATDDLRALHGRRMSAIDAAVPAPLRHLLKTHVALRHDLLAEAETAVREHLRGDPGERVGRDTLRFLLRKIGAAEGE